MRQALFDIDNTLVHHGDDSNPKVDKLFFELNNMGVKCVMVFDNNEERILRFIKNIDALAADPGGVRVPFSAGTSVSYNYIDFRFRNNTNQNIQLLAWVRDEKLYVELRSEKEFKRTYEIEEEDHHFTEEDGVYYRVSKIYKVTYDRDTKEVLKRKLIRDNHSQVMFDYELIPKELIR